MTGAGAAADGAAMTAVPAPAKSTVTMTVVDFGVRMIPPMGYFVVPERSAM